MPLGLTQYTSTLTLENDFEPIAFRDGTKQKIKAFFHQKQVWVCTDKQKGTLLKLQLIIRKQADPKGMPAPKGCLWHGMAQ